jgi:DNA-binding transcriptional LysR family regulator
VKNGQELTVAVKGALTLNDRQLAVEAAVQGCGIAFWAEHRLQGFLASGELVAILEDWSPTSPAFLLTIGNNASYRLR